MRKNLLLSVAALIASLFAAELILTVAGLPKYYSAHSGPAQFRFVQTSPTEFIYTILPNANICFEYDGNPRGYFDQNNSVCHQTNSLGFRGAEIQTPKPKDQFRIGVLGDSFTFGEGVKDADTYCALTEKQLSVKFSERDIRVLNFGVGGYNTQQEWELFTGLLSSLELDALVLCMTLNDAEPKLFYYDSADNSVKRRPRESAIHEGLPDDQAESSIFSWSRIYQMSWKLMNNKKISEQTIAYYNSLYMDYSESRVQQQSAIRKISQFAQLDSIPVCVMLFPLFYQLGSEYPFVNIHSKIRSEFENTMSPQFKFIDLLNDYDGYSGPELWVHPTDQHPNEEAHQIAADRLTEELSVMMDSRIP